jgi:signal transduction histidine kinase
VRLDHPSDITETELRTLIFAPTGRDAGLIKQLLQKAGKIPYVAGNAEDLAACIRAGAGAAIVTEEALQHRAVQALEPVLKEQPAWSDFPVILLISGGRVTEESERLRLLRMPLGNILLLERPLRPETLLATLEVALRSRQRQYQVRDQMEQVMRAQDALRRSEKLAVTGRLAASIAHEINNPLESVTNLFFLLKSEESPELRHTYLSLAEQELARVTEITKHTLRYYREPNKPVKVDVGGLLKSVLALYQPRLLSAQIELKQELRTPDLSVYTRPGELRQVIANLLANSLDAMRNGGRLRLRASFHKNGHAVRVTVADTGSGIDPKLLPNIFEPFVTTKGETGTGLGLWVIQELSRKNGWSVRIRSSNHPDHHGTVFSLLIPVDTAVPAETGSADRAPAPEIQ